MIPTKKPVPRPRPRPNVAPPPPKPPVELPKPDKEGIYRGTDMPTFLGSDRLDFGGEKGRVKGHMDQIKECALVCAKLFRCAGYVFAHAEKEKGNCEIKTSWGTPSKNPGMDSQQMTSEVRKKLLPPGYTFPLSPEDLKNLLKTEKPEKAKQEKDAKKAWQKVVEKERQGKLERANKGYAWIPFTQKLKVASRECFATDSQPSVPKPKWFSREHRLAETEHTQALDKATDEMAKVELTAGYQPWSQAFCAGVRFQKGQCKNHVWTNRLCCTSCGGGVVKVASGRLINPDLRGQEVCMTPDGVIGPTGWG